MKQQLSPAMVAVAIIVLVLVVGMIGFLALGKGGGDSAADDDPTPDEAMGDPAASTMDSTVGATGDPAPQ